jgi:uncharacterized coiled-coil protein SlyX
MADSAVGIDGTDPPADATTNQHTSINPEAHDGVKIKFELDLRAEINKSDNLNVRDLVRCMIAALIKTEEDTTIKTKDGSHSFSTMADFPEDKEKFNLFFVQTTSKHPLGPPKVMIKIHLRSAQNLASLKRTSTVFYKHLREEGIWLCQHNFETSNLQRIGLLAEISTEFALDTSIKDEISKRLKARSEEELAASTTDNVIDTQEAEKPPEFDISPRMITHSYKVAGRRTTVRTRAYEITCESTNKNRLCSLLTRPGKDRSGTFIPYSMARSNEQGFGDQIRKHNRFLDDCKKITVYGLRRQAMENPSPDSDNPTFRGHLLDFQDCTTDADGNDAYTPMLLSIEETNLTDEVGKWFFLCKEANKQRVIKWIDQHLPTLYKATETNFNHETSNKEDIFPPAPSRSNYSKHEETMEKYTAQLQASNPNSTSDSQDDSMLNGGYTYTRNRKSNKPRKTKETKPKYDPSEFPSPQFPVKGSNSTSAQDSYGQKDSYRARATANTVRRGPPPVQPRATKQQMDDEPAKIKNDFDRLRRQLEESDAKIAALVSTAKHQDDTIEKMQNHNNNTQATVDQLIAKINELVASLSREPKTDHEDESPIVTTTSKNKRSQQDSPPSSPSRLDHARKRVNDSITPIKRLWFSSRDNSRNDASTSQVDDASKNKPD